MKKTTKRQNIFESVSLRFIITLVLCVNASISFGQNEKFENQPRQLQFLDLLKNFVLEKGDVSKRNLIESPFTMLHPEGIRGIFNQKEIDEILSLTEKVLAA